MIEIFIYAAVFSLRLIFQPVGGIKSELAADVGLCRIIDMLELLTE